jgi:hypothetical protein
MVGNNGVKNGVSDCGAADLKTDNIMNYYN